MKITLLRTLIIVLLPIFSFAQQSKKDTFSLKRIFANGSIKGSIRQFSMLTDNAQNLTDYYALAIGAGLNYETKRWHGFQVNFGGFFVHDLASTDFSKPDPTTKTLSRYDSGLFDVLELNNQLISRIENLNIKYSAKKSTIIFGKQVLRTPLVNPQDGRMTSSMMEGLYLDFNEIKNLHLEGGWMYRASPRSTVKWFELQNSIGTYPMGVNTDGTKGNYLDNLSSKGLFLVGGNYAFNKNTKLIFWNYFIENISNTAMFQWNQEFGKPNQKFKYGFQFFRQNTLKFGGNIDPTKAYSAQNSKALILGGTLGYSLRKTSFNLNYTRITAEGRFQFPREWGRDPFFTFLQRERNEGFGDVHAFTTNLSHQLIDKKLLFDFGLGKYKLPDVKNYKLNKYGMPSYSQLNIALKYIPKGAFEGFDLQFLAVKKWNNGNVYNDEKYRINKVDMTNYNLVLNYIF